MKLSFLFCPLAPVCAAFALAATAFAGPLNTKGIPADAGGVVHVDFDAARNSAVGRLVLKRTFSMI
jgi:hypothetical protein